MTPNWPELWEREPGLRPDGLEFHPRESYVQHKWNEAKHTHVPTDPPVLGFHDAHWTHEHVERSCSADGDSIGPGTVDDSVASALARDAAVRWLLSNDGPHWNERLCFGLATGKTIDEALFAAVQAVLDAKETPCSSP